MRLSPVKVDKGECVAAAFHALKNQQEAFSTENELLTPSVQPENHIH